MEEKFIASIENSAFFRTRPFLRAPMTLTMPLRTHRGAGLYFDLGLSESSVECFISIGSSHSAIPRPLMTLDESNSKKRGEGGGNNRCTLFFDSFIPARCN